MKTIVISDTHLTNKFNQRKYDFLSKIIESADKVIINGDFWDSWHTNFDKFLNSKWQELFPMLLEKSAIYIYGNHDPQHKNNSKTKQFSIKSESSYFLKIRDQLFFFTHGDDLIKNFRPAIIKLYYLILKKTENLLVGKVFRKFVSDINTLSFFIFGANRMTETRIAKHNNLLLKLQNKYQNQWLICGDTHCAEIDNDLLFGNSGSIEHGIGSYLVIEDNKISLIKEKY